MVEGFLIKIKNSLILHFAFCIFNLLMLISIANAQILDRVVAIVDDEAITLSELNEVYQKALHSKAEVTQEEVLNGLINRILILKQAKRFSHNIQAGSDYNALINEYIEKQLKTFIRIPVEEIEQYYEKNKESLGNKDFYDVRDKIEEYLIEKELNKKLIRHIEELRKNAYIKIQLAEN